MQRFLLISLSGLLVAGTLLLLMMQEPNPEKTPHLTEPIAEMPIGFESAKSSIRIVDKNEQANAPVRDNKKLIARLPSTAPIPVAKRKKETAPKTISIELVRPLIKRAGWMTTDDYTVSLNNIKAPSPQDWCLGTSKPWPCGPLARTAMRKFIRGRTAICITQATDGKSPKNTPRPAQCLVRGVDVAKWLVEQGWAVADTDSELKKVMAVARKKKKGLWRNGAKINFVKRPKS